LESKGIDLIHILSRPLIMMDAAVQFSWNVDNTVMIKVVSLAAPKPLIKGNETKGAVFSGMLVINKAPLVAVSRTINGYLCHYLISVHRIVFCINLADFVGIQCSITPRLSRIALIVFLWMVGAKRASPPLRSYRNNIGIFYIVTMISFGSCSLFTCHAILLIASCRLIFIAAPLTKPGLVSHCLSLTFLTCLG
jgi:hypothetical protein